MASALLTFAIRRFPPPPFNSKGFNSVPHMMRRGDVRLVKIAVCLGVVLCFVSARQTVHTESVLVAHWKLDERNGTKTADSAGNKHGSLENGVAWTTGVSGAAVYLDGVNGYIDLPRLDLTGSTITLSAWVRNSSFATGVSQRFVSKAADSTEDGTYWMLGQANDGQNRLQFRLKSGGVTTTLIASAGDLPLNTWYHASATYDGSTMRLYLNGAQVGSVAKSGSISRSSGRVSVEIGRSPESSNYLRGAIDDVRIYSSALTPAEIAALAGTGAAWAATTVSGNQLSNQPPTVSLTAPTSDSTFTIPASITVSATASDVDGSIAGVDFYAGPVLLGTDASSPYSVSWTERVAASYPIVAVARDSGGASTVSSTRDIMVIPAGLPRTLVFTPATNHETAVDRYAFEVFPLGANTTVANPVATQDLGMPSITNGECRADIAATVFALPPGTYIATVTASGSGGSPQSAPSAQFTR